jgi:protoporphyrinogen oxidase
MIREKARSSPISILGGGIAGLSAGYFARKKGLPFTIYESKEIIGGNCLTLKHQDFLFDSGAHRFHNKDWLITQELKKLLGDELREIRAPSQIYHDGLYIDFPLSPLNLILKLGAFTLLKATFELVRARLSHRGSEGNFEEFALHAYGKTIAELFLLGYSRKLWGMPPSRLSPVISGGRLKGLTISAFLFEAFGGNKKKTKHLDGSFYYPQHGIQVIPEKLAEFCGRDHILTNSRITRIFHDSRKLRAIEINGRDRIETSQVINTLPLSLFLGLLDPPPTREILSLAKTLRFRDLLLVALYLNKTSVSRNASIYFPDSGLPFARMYEPKNRSRCLAPPDKTAVVVECPCAREDQMWSAADSHLIDSVRAHLARISLIKEEDVLGGLVVRMEYAYPVIERETEEKREEIFGFLERFENLKCSGRGALFEYIHIHDIMRISKEIIDGLSDVEAGTFLGNAENLEQSLDIHLPFVPAQGEKAAH